MPADGRAARALRTREAIVDACIALVEEGDLRPTAPRIAERAGVSVRSVFQHFDDLPSLHIAVTESIAERMAALVVPIDATLPLDDRIARFVEQRSNLLEAMTPFRVAAASTVRSPPRSGGGAQGSAVPPRRGGAGVRAGAGRGARHRDECSTPWPWRSRGACGTARADAGDTPEQARVVLSRLLAAVLVGPVSLR